MAYSYQTAVSDGTLDTLAVSIPYFDRSEISVYFDGVANDYPWSWIGTTEATLAFSPPIPNGVVVQVKRSTDISARRHDFTGGAMFTSESIDENFEQIMRMAQEAKEGGWGEGVDTFKDTLASSAGGTLVGVLYDGETRQLEQVLDEQGTLLDGLQDSVDAAEAAIADRIPEVANYAAVRAGLGGLSSVYVRGRENIFDGGFGVFRLKAGDTTTEDNDGTVLVDSVSGARYFREFSGWCDALWFGALADGTDVTVELQAAIAAYPYVDLPAGVIRHSRLVLKHQNQILRGKGRGVTVLHCPSGYAITNYSGGDSDPIGSDWVGNPTFEKLTLRGGFIHTDDFSAPANSWAFSTGRAKTFTTTGINAGLRLKRCYPYTLNEVNIEHFHRGVYASAAALGRWSNFEVADCEYGMYGENGAVWGESAWQVTTHRWSQGRFKNCWIGIGGSDFVQCQVDKKTVDFEPCNTGIAITNGGDNVWSGYFELCSEGIYRTGGDMGHDVIEDPFFAGEPGAFWGSGDSILLDSGIGPSGKVTLRHGLGKINGGGLRVLGGRIVQPERSKFGATLYLSPELTPPGGYSATDVQWGLSSPADDVLGVYSASAPTRVTIPAALHGARVRLKTNLEIAGDATANDVLVSFHKNGASFAGSGQFSGVFQYGRTISFETAPLTVSTGDYFTLVVLMNLSRTLPTGGHCWLSLEVLE